jgi:hypothetical protein
MQSFSSQCKHSASSESRHSHSVLTPDAEHALVSRSTLHAISVSNPDTVHSVSSPDTKRVPVATPLLHHHLAAEPIVHSDTDHSVSTPDARYTSVVLSPSSPLHDQLIAKGFSRARPNTTPKFQAFDPSIRVKVRSTLQPERWRSFLKHYPDPEFPNIIAGISEYGARVGYEGPFVRVRGRNHPSVLRIPSEISKNITTEAAAHQIHEILNFPQFYYISPLSAVEK